MQEQEITDIGEKIVQVLKTIFDPEIPVDIYELGIDLRRNGERSKRSQNFNDFDFS